MHVVNVEGRVLPLTESGFLVEAADWNAAVADALAARANLRLTAAHWEILHFIRDYHTRYQHLPNARMFVKAVQKHLGDDKGNSRYLHGLFPDGPVRYACLIAGLPKPPGCV